MAVMSVTQLNQNISAALRLAEREDLIIEKSGRPTYKIVALPHDAPLTRALASGQADRVIPAPQTLTPRRVAGVSSVDALSQARGRR